MKTISLALLILLSINTLLAEDKTYSGLYIYGKDVNTFQPCGGKVFWADGSDLVMGPVEKFYKEEAGEPGQAIYVMVRGHRHFEESKPPVSDYAGIIHFSEVYLFSSVVPDTCSSQEENVTKETK